MRIVEQIGRTVDEAKEAALRELGLEGDSSSVIFEVIDEGSKGVFGLGIKYARIKAIIKEDDADLAEEMLSEILRLMKLCAVVEKEYEKDNMTRLNISGEDLGLLIGKHGQTLESLQYILNIMASKRAGKKCRFIVDVEGYRLRRERSLQDMAFRMAEAATRDGRNVALDPMLPNERRIVHLALQNNPKVTTFSQGEEPLRKVVISPRKPGSEKVEEEPVPVEND
jgi:spoIIIJ-associated protein